jgi:hypothetical protein
MHVMESSPADIWRHLASRNPPTYAGKAHLSSVDDAHIHATECAPMQKRGVERSADRLVSAKGEGNVGHPSGHFAAWANVLEGSCRSEELYCIVVVLCEAGADCENVGVEDDVLRAKAHLKK